MLNNVSVLRFIFFRTFLSFLATGKEQKRQKRQKVFCRFADAVSLMHFIFRLKRLDKGDYCHLLTDLESSYEYCNAETALFPANLI
jgi:hypothetical protein